MAKLPPLVLGQHQAPALCLVVLALVAGGCGESEKEKYEKGVDEIGQTLEKEFAQIGRDIQASGGLENAAPEIEESAELLDEAAADLEELDPPGDAERAHRLITAGVNQLAAEFRDAADAALAGRLQPVLDLFSDVEASEGAKRIEAARRELERKGYDVEE